MKREELIEVMARAGIRAGIQSEELARCVAVFMPSAIEASRHAIVPVEATEAMLEAAWGAMFEEPYDCTSDHMIKAGCDAMIKAGKI